MLITALFVAALAAPPPTLEITVGASRAPPFAEGQRVLLEVTARNAGREAILFLPRALSLNFAGSGARLQTYDEGPVTPPMYFEARVLAPDTSTRVELVATWTDAKSWQLPAGGGRRANWFLPWTGKYAAVVKYSVPDPPFPPDTRVPAGVVWTGELVAAPVTLEVPRFAP